MRFRPCIDIHNGKVKQIVGGSLQDEGELRQGELCLRPGRRRTLAEAIPEGWACRRTCDPSEPCLLSLLPGDQDGRRLSALAAYPGGLQAGGGITAGKRGGIPGRRGKPCDRDFLYLPGRPDPVGEPGAPAAGGGERADRNRRKLPEAGGRRRYRDRSVAEVYRCEADRSDSGEAWQKL